MIPPTSSRFHVFIMLLVMTAFAGCSRSPGGINTMYGRRSGSVA